ncbi:MAG: 3-oxoacyl-ACP synthase [Acidimicrobiia bacterium]
MNSSEDVIRNLLIVWTDFESRLNNVPILKKLSNSRFTIDDYKELLVNHRQQVVEGSRWIARAASSITSDYLDLRSNFLKHAVTEHRDYEMLERQFVEIGGSLEEIRNSPKNIGTEIFHSYMFEQSSSPNPFHLLGSMFIIEGLGQRKAKSWGEQIKSLLKLSDSAVEFYIYHGENDPNHMEEFDQALNSGILDLDNMGAKIVKTAKITALLYELQLREIGNY